jgi:hypothetical protein
VAGTRIGHGVSFPTNSVAPECGKAFAELDQWSLHVGNRIPDGYA